MGENAAKSWEWHNTVVGSGYQAKSVIRQRQAAVDLQPGFVVGTGDGIDRHKFIDMRGSSSLASENPPPCEIDGVDPTKVDKKGRKEDKKVAKAAKKASKKAAKKEKKDAKREKREKKEKKRSKKETKKKKEQQQEYEDDKSNCNSFNPLLQLFANRISNTTRSFSVANAYD